MSSPYLTLVKGDRKRYFKNRLKVAEKNNQCTCNRSVLFSGNCAMNWGHDPVESVEACIVQETAATDRIVDAADGFSPREMEDRNIESRHYPLSEWKTLSEDEQRGVQRLRAMRKGRRIQVTAPKQPSYQQRLAATKYFLSFLERAPSPTLKPKELGTARALLTPSTNPPTNNTTACGCSNPTSTQACRRYCFTYVYCSTSYYDRPRSSTPKRRYFSIGSTKRWRRHHSLKRSCIVLRARAGSSSF